MSMSNGGTDSRPGMHSTGHPSPPDRRRRGKNPNGYYMPRERLPNGYRGDTRVGNRASGDGPHNSGNGHRTTNDYDPQSGCMNQGGPQEGHVRSNHHQPSTHHSHQQYYNKTLPHGGRGDMSNEYDGHSSANNASRRGMTMDQRGVICNPVVPPISHMDPRNIMVPPENTFHPQQTGIPCGPPPGLGPVNEIVMPQEQIIPFQNGNGGNFQGPFLGPPPMNFGFHPNYQPTYGTLAICHIPMGVNPSAVISPVVYTQIIGSGIVTPGLPYHVPCGFHSPMVQSPPVFFHHGPTHHHHHPHVESSGIQPQSQVPTTDGSLTYQDSPSELNPDADVFFPPTFPTGEEIVCNENPEPEECPEAEEAAKESDSETVTPLNEADDKPETTLGTED